MFGALGRFVSRFPWLVIAAWVVLAVLVVALAPKLTATSDQASFLPDTYESIKAADIQEREFPGQTQPGALLVFDRADGERLSTADLGKAAGVMQALNGKLGKTFQEGTAETLVVQPSQDGLAAIGVFGLGKDSTGFDQQAMDDAKQLRKDARPLAKEAGLRLKIGGSPASGLDSQESTDDTMVIVGIATVLLIVVLLAIIFRSVIICLLPILVVGLVSEVATGLIAWANDIFDLKADSSVQVILIVVLYGIGTDYILFLLFRHRERLRLGDDVRTAVVGAMERAGEAIASAGGAVIVAFLALVLSSLGIFKSIGPALAIAVAITLLAALTLVPAVVTLLGRALFWPSRSWRQEPRGARFAAVGNSLGRRPAVFALASGAVLVALSVFALGFNPSFDFNSSLPSDAESTEATDTLQQHFAAGASDPAPVVLEATGGTIDQQEAVAFSTRLEGVEGVDQVLPPTVAADGSAAIVNLILSEDPTGDPAFDDIEGPIRDAAHAAAPDGTKAYVGGTTSVFVDMNKAMIRDYKVVFPVAALVILLILAGLLRSLVAPWYLMLSVGLGFAATLGATVLVIQHAKGDGGLIFMLPIYIYLFVVALGTDYNILMIARLREEAREGRDPHAAAAEAVKHAGPTIAAAGIILAGTFASLMLGGNALIVSMGFALSIGILVAAFVMSMFFTPALTALIGHAAWWPGHGDETAEEHEARLHAKGS